jgi:vitamin B12 transporter
LGRLFTMRKITFNNHTVRYSAAKKATSDFRSLLCFSLTPFMCAALASTVNASELEELIVTGSYSPVAIEQLSAQVTVLNQRQLQQLGGANLIGALRQIPGLWIDEQGGPGGVTSINLRGAESNHTLVLLDGVPLNDPTNSRGGGFDLNAINMESIERIEIIRGAQSAIYGSDALAGVIQIITRASGTARTQVQAGLGEQGEHTAAIATRGRHQNMGYKLRAQTRTAGDSASGSSANNSELMAQLDWQQGEQNWDASYRRFAGERSTYPEQSGGPRYAQSASLDSSDYRDQQAALGWSLAVNDSWRTSLKGNWYERTDSYTSPGIAPYYAVPPNGANTEFERSSLSWVNTLGDQTKLWANLGLETKNESGSSEGYLDYGDLIPTNFALTRRTHSGFININGYVNSALLLQASLRSDKPAQWDAQNSTQLGARYSFSEQLSVFANWGQGYKLPSFFALGHPLVGNENLVPETAETSELGLAWQAGALAANLSLFNNQYRQLVDFDSETFKNVNRDKVNTEGLEAELNWQVNTQWQWRLQGSYTDIDMLSSSNHLTGRPQTTLGSSVHYQPNADWDFNVNYLNVAERFAVSLYSGSAQEQVLKSYQRLDANAYWQYAVQARLGITLENLGDSRYETDIGFPADGRRIKLSVDVQF